MAFGLLDGGRGLLAAVTGSIMVAVFAALLPIDPELASLQQRTAALRQVIVLLLSITAASAVLIFLVLPKNNQPHHASKPRLTLRGIAHVAATPAVCLQAGIIRSEERRVGEDGRIPRGPDQ